MRAETARAFVSERLIAHGFDAVGFASAADDDDRPQRLKAFIEAGRHGSMAWMAETLERRANPRALWRDANTIIMTAMNYAPDTYDPLAALEHRSNATISCYAHNRDYHDVIKGKLKQVAGQFAAKTGAEVKVFVDTAPLMEKPLAQSAGLGWQGKHTNLVSRELGSWFFLGAILTDMDLATDAPEIDHCGSCRACLDVCPTDAFPAPYQLDARRCISYLTIEHDGPIDPALRPAMGNRIYGCDDCLAVCPWNKFAAAAREAKLMARDDMVSPPLVELLALDDAAFRARFSGSPIKRIGRNRFIRNCLIAAGNSGDATLVPPARHHLSDTNSTVRGAAVWALKRLMSDAEFYALRAMACASETDASVIREWEMEIELYG
ncbi:MAG: tRNA epoxyqueuosine(34) reductase QueG [Pseudomonadota bacterium]